MARHIVAIDQGTTNTKVLVVDGRGTVLARASRPVEIAFPQPGWVEQDGELVWRTVKEALDECLAQVPAASVTAIGLTNQRESVLVWDRATGRPLGPCIVWQCRRTAPFCATLRDRGLGPMLEEKTGLTIDPLFSASKIRWLIDAIPDGPRRAAAGEVCAGTMDSWVLWNLTGRRVHACDATNASRTQLFNLASGTWDEALLDVFGVPRATLPAIHASSGIAGETVPRGRVPGGIPIASLIGDSHAALFGHAAFEPGSAKATYGTGSSLMTLITDPRRSARGLSTTVAWAVGDRLSYALEGNITSTGGAVDWFGHFLGGSQTAETVAAMAETVPDSGGVYVVPAFAGLGAPHWDDGARGLISGLTRGTTSAHVARATIEAIGYQVRDVFDAMRAEAGVPLAALLADGGASRNDMLMQLQADVLGCPVVRNLSTDLSAFGAAWLAGLATGVWSSFDSLSALPRKTDRFEPRMPPADRERRYRGWTDAVARARSRGSQPAGAN